MVKELYFWNDFAAAADMEAMWAQPAVRAEWTSRGAPPGGRVAFSALRGDASKPEVTRTEMLAMAGIVVSRHFAGKVDPVMVAAVAMVESSLLPLAYRYEPHRGEASTGIMQVLQSTADWLASDMGFRFYSLDWATSMLYRPFEATYFGTAYLCWLSTYKKIRRTEEFIVRGYNGGPGGVDLASTKHYWEKYLKAKKVFQDFASSAASSSSSSLPSHTPSASHLAASHPPSSPSPSIQSLATSLSQCSLTPQLPMGGWVIWDEVATSDEMTMMWQDPRVADEWKKAGEERGRVRMMRDSKMMPFLSKVEMRAVVSITLKRHFPSSRVKLEMLVTMVELLSKRQLYGGLDGKTFDGVFNVKLSTAFWLQKDMGYRAKLVSISSDMWSPFVSTYFGVAYATWLSTYDNMARDEEFIVRAYVAGPSGVHREESLKFWRKYEDATKTMKQH